MAKILPIGRKTLFNHSINRIGCTNTGIDRYCVYRLIRILLCPLCSRNNVYVFLVEYILYISTRI